MFFILSKILVFLLSPFFWIVLLLGWSFYTKKEKRKKYLRIISLVLFIVFTNPYLFNVLVRAWQPDVVVLPKEKKYSAGILLGGVTKTDIYDRTYFGADADRFIQTTKLFQSGSINNIVVTGGNASIIKSKKTPEAIQVRDELLLQGIPAKNIFIEYESKNTFENAVLTKRLLDSLQLPPPYIMITSAMHVPRAKAVFKKAGIEVIAYPAAFKEINSKRSFTDYVVPSIEVLGSWNIFLKEVVGFSIYRVTNKA
jgi:uncharacterized SAM-binding protein YcdF (DUF218 family)